MYQPAPPQRQQNSGGGVLGANRVNYRNNYQNNYRNNYRNEGMNNFYPRNDYQMNRNPYVNRRNIYYNRNYSENYPIQRWNPQNRYIGYNNRRSPSNPMRQRSRSAQRGPRVMRLNDFMPPNFRELSAERQELPNEFNLVTTSANVSRSTTPTNALPQRPQFVNQVTTTNNSNNNNFTQPFSVQEQGELHSNNRRNQAQNGNRNRQPRQGQQTTSSYRRRQRRNRQQEYRSMSNTVRNNRFAPLDEGETSDFESNMNEIDNQQQQTKVQQKKKKRLYLESNRIMKYLQENSANVIGGRGNQAYALASSAVYDDWVRANYELQVWQVYLKMGQEEKHWAKEVIQRTKRRDDVVCTRFVQKKIGQLQTKIAECSALISDLQVQLGTYWIQTNTSAAPLNASTNPNRPRDPVDRIEKAILRYIHHCTQHVKKISENKILLGKAQMQEFKALQDFEQIATPLQWNIHLALRSRVKLWSTKNKNYQVALKQVEYERLPKFIEKIELTFKIDETVIGQEEAQTVYNQMRQVTKDYRRQAMTLYVQSLNREYELLTEEIRRRIEGFPNENDDGFDCEPGNAAFKHYHGLRERRMNLETEQSIYFLDEQRIAGDPNRNREPEEIVAPMVTRSLGEEFLLQQ